MVKTVRGTEIAKSTQSCGEAARECAGVRYNNWVPNSVQTKVLGKYTSVTTVITRTVDESFTDARVIAHIDSF